MPRVIWISRRADGSAPTQLKIDKPGREPIQLKERIRGRRVIHFGSRGFASPKSWEVFEVISRITGKLGNAVIHYVKPIKGEPI